MILLFRVFSDTGEKIKVFLNKRRLLSQTITRLNGPKLPNTIYQIPLSLVRGLKGPNGHKQCSKETPKQCQNLKASASQASSSLDQVQLAWPCCEHYPSSRVRIAKSTQLTLLATIGNQLQAECGLVTEGSPLCEHVDYSQRTYADTRTRCWHESASTDSAGGNMDEASIPLLLLMKLMCFLYTVGLLLFFLHRSHPSYDLVPLRTRIPLTHIRRFFCKSFIPCFPRL